MSNTFTCAHYWRVLPSKSGLKKAAFSFCLPPSISLKVHSFYRPSFIIFPHYQTQTHQQWGKQTNQQTNKKPCSLKVPVSPKFNNKTLSLKFLSMSLFLASLLLSLGSWHIPQVHTSTLDPELFVYLETDLYLTLHSEPELISLTFFLPCAFQGLYTFFFLRTPLSSPFLSFAPLVAQGDAFSHPSLSTSLLT